MFKIAPRMIITCIGIFLLILCQRGVGFSNPFKFHPSANSKIVISVVEYNVAQSNEIERSIKHRVIEGDHPAASSDVVDSIFNSDYNVRSVHSADTAPLKTSIPDRENFVNPNTDSKDVVCEEPAGKPDPNLQAQGTHKVNTPAALEKIKSDQNVFVVTTANDAGKGSLREAILNANAHAGRNTIRFDSTIDTFEAPCTIVLTEELPDLAGELTIDGYIEGRLWKASGVTVSGEKLLRVFKVAPSSKVRIKNLTIAGGRAESGGAIANHGALVVEGVTFIGNEAVLDGGALVNIGGRITVINTTFADNTAGHAGGALADFKGWTTITNCTFSANTAQKGGGIFSSGTLLLRNSIIANSEGSADCVAEGELDPASTNNLIESNIGCGEPISTGDPDLQPFAYYNGPTQTFPLGGGSPAINLGDNDSAVDEHGEPLRWDQRGNGDPRFVGGITDIGAFEVQAFPQLTVDTFEDTELRACSPAGKADCSLRGAILLANAEGKPAVIKFDPGVFGTPRTIFLSRTLPTLTTGITFDAAGTSGVILSPKGRFEVISLGPEGDFQLINIIIEN